MMMKVTNMAKGSEIPAYLTIFYVQIKLLQIRRIQECGRDTDYSILTNSQTNAIRLNAIGDTMREMTRRLDLHSRTQF